MTVLRTRVWPWFVLAIVVIVIGAAILHGTGKNVVISLGAFLFLGACIRAIGLAVRENEVSSLMIRRQNLDGAAAAETRRRPARPHDDA
jgi:hypothetical protein